MRRFQLQPWCHEAAALYRNGKSIETTSNVLGVSAWQIRRALMELGEERRTGCRIPMFTKSMRQMSATRNVQNKSGDAPSGLSLFAKLMRRAEVEKFRRYSLGQPCLVWTGPRSKYGHGEMRVPSAGATQKGWTHRMMWLAAVGSIPAGMHVLHSCDNPPCMNPSHLRLGTARDNMEDMHRRGRARTTGEPCAECGRRLGDLWDSIRKQCVTCRERIARIRRERYAKKKARLHVESEA